MREVFKNCPFTLENELVEKIVEECENYPISPGLVGSTDGDLSKVRVEEVHRICDIRWINKQKPTSRFISDMLWTIASEVNKDCFGFDLTSIGDIQYTIYKGENGGHYNWHHDVFWVNNKCVHRKLSMTVQLTDPEEYEGGDFEFDLAFPQNPAELRKKGTVLVFPSFMMHRVSPVTKGVRKSLVCWIEGPKFR